MSHVLPSDPISHEQALVARFQRKLLWIKRSYILCRAVEALTGGYNESLANLKRAAGPRARPGTDRKRAHPHIELLMQIGLLDQPGRQGAPDVDSRAARSAGTALQCAAQLPLIRGRPADAILTHHVRYLMALIYETTGKEVTATRSKDSVYAPQMTSAGGRVVEQFFQSIDRSITTIALVNIILSARASREIDGQTFGDLNPFYSGSIDSETGAPLPRAEYKIVSLEPLRPINYS